MKRRRQRVAPEIPLTSTADVAFLLLVFFLVAASSQTDIGRTLDLPGTLDASAEATKNVQVVITPTVLAIDGEVMPPDQDLNGELARRLQNATEPSQRVVMVASDGEVTYQRWSDVISAIEAAGGIPAPQMDEGDSAGGAGAGQGLEDAP